MKSFSIYLEDKTRALIPKGGTLEDFLRSLEGSDRDATDFVNKLTRFVNRDVGQKRPKVREYETDQFKQENDYESYNKARSQKARLGLNRLKARREGKEDEMNKINDEIDKLQDFLSNHPYQRGMSMIEREYDQAVQDYHNTPLTAEYLTDDGSESYDELVAAFAKLGGQSETVIDV